MAEKDELSAYDIAGEVWYQQRGPGHELLEKPAMYELCGDVSGKAILCVGCGFGDECRDLSLKGARSVVGIDLAENSIAKASERFPDIEFKVMDMEKLDFEDQSFDLVFSSLSIHYLPDWTETLKEMARTLRPEGEIVISTHHPASWGGERFEDDNSKSQLLGYKLDKNTGEMITYGDYLDARKIDGKFSGKFAVSYYHKPFSEILANIRAAGLKILDCTEPAPIERAETENPVFAAVRSKFPLFVLFKLQRLD